MFWKNTSLFYFNCFDSKLKELQSEWRVVFYISAGVFFLGGIVFVIFGSSELEEWAKIEDDKTKQEEEEN